MKIRIIDWVFAVLLALTLACSAYTAFVVFRTVEAVRTLGNDLSAVTGEPTPSPPNLEQADWADWVENPDQFCATHSGHELCKP